MNNAEKIIQKFGGQTELAKLINKGQSTVQHWAKTGLIPAKWQTRILQLAQERGILLGATDFIKETNQNIEILDKDQNVIPEAQFFGTLKIGIDIPCYVLDDGRRVISRTAATNVLTEKSSGDFESYLRVEGLKKHLPVELYDQMIEFTIKGTPKPALGIDAETFLEICRAYVRARDENDLKTERQVDIAIKAGMFLSACAKVGLIALIDEATGYQYQRPEDFLQFKLKLYLAEEMRAWEKTFPDELWQEFGRLTNWSGSIRQRPKYWGKLVMELIYGYLDSDVAEWLQKNAPKPRGNLSYHRWLSEQFGLKKLMEHMWMTIGMAKACSTMYELREKMARQFGHQLVQLSLPLTLPTKKYLPIRNNSSMTAENE